MRAHCTIFTRKNLSKHAFRNVDKAFRANIVVYLFLNGFSINVSSWDGGTRVRSAELVCFGCCLGSWDFCRDVSCRVLGRAHPLCFKYTVFRAVVKSPRYFTGSSHLSIQHPEACSCITYSAHVSLIMNLFIYSGCALFCSKDCVWLKQFFFFIIIIEIQMARLGQKWSI